MQHVSLAVGGPGGAEVESRLPRGDEVGLCGGVKFHGGAAGSSVAGGAGQMWAELLSAAAPPAPSDGSPRP